MISKYENNAATMKKKNGKIKRSEKQKTTYLSGVFWSKVVAPHRPEILLVANPNN